MIGAFLSLKSDLDPLPVFDEKGRPIGLGKIWWVDEQNQVQGKYVEGDLESPVFEEIEDGFSRQYEDEWGEEVLMMEPVRSGSESRGHFDDPGKENDFVPNAQPLTQAQSQIVWWEEVEEAAKLIFQHRPSEAGLQITWNILIQHGSARYTNESERVRVLLRFVTLGFLWQTSYLPQKETDVFPLDEYSFAWVTKLLGLSPCRLGWVAGLMNIALPGITSESTEFEVTTQMLPRLVEQIRSEVVNILQKHFGGTEKLSACFSQHGISSVWDRDDKGETSENFPGEARLQKEKMEAWVEKGCPFPSNLFV
jgi:hypothetical protein